jgi:hypothetical protein
VRCAAGRVRAGGLALPEGKAGWRGGRGVVPGGDLRRVLAVAGVEAAGPGADRRGGLACRPGPQASTLHSARPVKSAPPGAGAGLTPGPEPRVTAGRYPPRQEGTAPRAGRPPGGYREGCTVAPTAKVRATGVHAPDADRRPGTGAPGCARRIMLTGGSAIGRSLTPPGFPSSTEIELSGPFSSARRKLVLARQGNAGVAGGLIGTPGSPPVFGLAGATGLAYPGSGCGAVQPPILVFLREAGEKGQGSPTRASSPRRAFLDHGRARRACAGWDQA